MEQNDEPIWIEGKIRDYDLNLNKIFLVNVRLSNVEDEIDAEELELLLPGKKFNRLHLYHGRNIRLYGRIRDHHEQGFLWKLELKQWGITSSNEVHSKIQQYRNRVGLLLMDRAAFYLPADVLSIYLPLFGHASFLFLFSQIISTNRNGPPSGHQRSSHRLDILIVLLSF